MGSAWQGRMHTCAHTGRRRDVVRQRVHSHREARSLEHSRALRMQGTIGKKQKNMQQSNFTRRPATQHATLQVQGVARNTTSMQLSKFRDTSGWPAPQGHARHSHYNKHCVNRLTQQHATVQVLQGGPATTCTATLQVKALVGGPHPKDMHGNKQVQTG
jgi:hypothetical protein